MSKKVLHQKYCEQNEKICNWFDAKAAALQLPIYSSFDIRDSGFKVANVDGNIYPAGFNNICPTDKDLSIEVFSDYLNEHYGNSIQKILLVTEAHTGNPYYWDNALTIKSLLESSGKKVLIAVPKKLEAALKVKSFSGAELTVVSAFPDDPTVRDFNPDLVVSNNDFSEAAQEWGDSNGWPVNPPRELGWYQRKKSNYFDHYNKLAHEFADVCQIPAFQISVRTELYSGFELGNPEAMQGLATKIDQLITNIRKDYDQHGITEEPFVFVKNNAGTYGLGVTKVSTGAEVLNWTYNARKKMKAAKGGRDIEEVIIQEGIPSLVKSEGAVAEPVIYMIGNELAGGFLRTHQEKSENESLNSPGAVYKKLCVSDLQSDRAGSILENVYGWSAKLGVLAIGLEARQMGIEFKKYRSSVL